MSDGLSRFPAPPRVREGSAAAEDAIPALLDAALSSHDLRATLLAVARWWAARTAPAPAALGVFDDAGRTGLVAVARTGGPAAVETLPDCRQERPLSCRDVVCQRLGGEEQVLWLPLADRGRVFGGVACSAQGPQEPSRTLWTDCTARLLADAIRRSDRLEAEKLASLAEFAAGAGHEINNPLGTILGRIQLLLREEQHPDRQRTLSTIGAQALRVRDMIGDVMLFARPPDPDLQEVRWNDLIEPAIEAQRSEWSRRGLTLSGDRDAAVKIRADRTQAQIVVDELLRNATRAAPDGTTVRIDLRFSGAASGWAVLDVSDCGPGLSAADRRHLYDPFYSGRQAGRGLGFGLAKCWRIVQEHGGCLHADPLDPGLRMSVHWPTA